MSNKKKLVISKTSTVVIYGNKIHPKIVWIVLHGYGQLSSYFIKKFEPLNFEENFVIAPEALSRYYLSGNNGRVGATWMTKHEREIDIEDNHNYLDQVYQNFVPKNFTGKVILLGFSQGAATAARWIAKTNYHIDYFVLWASVFPPDLQINSFLRKQVKTKLVIGDKDEYLSSEDIDKHCLWAKENSLAFNVMKFKGNHSIPPETLLSLEENILAN